MSSASLYDTLPGSGIPVLLDAASSIGYPAANVATTFGTVVASRVYAADLSSLHLASGGNIAFTVDDKHSLDLSLSNDDTAVFESIAGGIRIESASNSSIEVDSNIALSAAADMTVSVPASGSIAYTVDGVPAVVSEYDAAGVLRTRIRNLEVPDGINAGYAPHGAVDSSFHEAKLSWAANEGVSVMGGRYDDLITDGNGANVPRCVAEPVWNFSGGAVGFQFKSPSSGRSLRYHWRINSKDELELVKQVYSASDANESNKVAARFGLHQGVSKEFAGAGAVIYREVGSSAGAVHAAIDAFSSGPAPYDLHIACIPTTASRPTGEQLADPAFANKVVVSALSPATTRAVNVGAPSYSVQAPAATVAPIAAATDSSGSASTPVQVGQDYYLLVVADEPGKPIAAMPATFVFTGA